MFFLELVSSPWFPGPISSFRLISYLSNHLFSTSRSSRLCVLSLGFDGVAEQRIHGLSKCGCDNNRKEGWKCASRIVRIWILAPKTSSYWSISTGYLDGGWSLSRHFHGLQDAFTQNVELIRQLWRGCTRWYHKQTNLATAVCDTSRVDETKKAQSPIYQQTQQQDVFDLNIAQHLSQEVIVPR